MWSPGRDFVPPSTQGLHFSIVYYLFHYLSIPVGLGSSVTVSILSSLDAFAGSFPFETFLALNYCLTPVYNLSNARVRLFLYRFQIVHFSPTHSLHHKTRSSRFRFGFWSFFLAQKSSMNRAPDAEEGRVIELDYAPMHNGSTDIHIFWDWTGLRSYAQWIRRCSHLSATKCGHPRMVSLSETSFTVLRSSFRYSRFFIHY